MNTLSLTEAAALCKKSPATMKRFARGRIDVGRYAAKVGKNWLWLESDLLEHIRLQQVVPCHSTSQPTHRTGTRTSRSQDTHAYVSQLDVLIAQRRKKSMT